MKSTNNKEEAIKKLDKSIKDLTNHVQSELSSEKSTKLGKTMTPYRQEKIRFLNKLKKILTEYSLNSKEMAVCSISNTDVLIVAKKNGIEMSEEQVKKVIDIYNHEEECDPNSKWEEVVLYCIKQVVL
jgi:hypothetical protein